MFKHIFRYKLKLLVRTKASVFWNLFFPIILATLFYCTISNLSSEDNYEAANIAVVDNEKYEQSTYFKQTLESASDSESENALFNLQEVSQDNAENLLSKGKICGYIVVDDDINMVIKENGVEQTILKSFLDQYKQIESTITNVAMINNGEVSQEIISNITSRTNYVSSKNEKNANWTVVFFYALLAMTCMYGSNIGVSSVTLLQADLSAVASRVNMMPFSKPKFIIPFFTGGILVQIIQTFIVFLYINVVLKIDFGPRTGFVLLLVIVGCITGYLMGTFVGGLLKCKDGTKIGIVTSITMILTFLSGMMSTDIKYTIQKNVPALAKINPCNLITDGCYSLYYYDSLNRYLSNLFILVVMSAIFAIGTAIFIRRQQYECL